LEISLPESPAELKAFFDKLDKFVLSKALEWGRKLYKAILEQADKLMAEHREKGLKIEHMRGVWYQTCLGAVKVQRRQYHDDRGSYRYLLDEMVGVDRHCHITSGVQSLALELASVMPYRRSAEVLRKTSGIDLTHQTIWRLMGKTADPYLKKAEEEVKWFLKTGEIPEGDGKKASRLLIEADGVMLSLQREKERKAEVKLGIAYEGWETVGKDRYRTVNKTVFAAMGNCDSFWAGMSLKLQRKYDLSRLKEIIVGGDGAAWVKEGVGFVNGQFQLDRYHLHRELCTALGQDRQTKAKIWQACEHGDVDTALLILGEAMTKTRGEQARRIANAYRYLSENRLGLGDYRLRLGEAGKELRRTGAMEGNVDKLVVRRMKNQGMSWTLKGIRRLLWVRFLVLEGQLESHLRSGNPKEGTVISRKKARRVVTQLSVQEPDTWLQAGLPALTGPYASRPWVRLLKSMCEMSV
jgi:hypothetical protein